MRMGKLKRRTKGSRSEQGEHNARARPITLEDLALDQDLAGVRAQLLLHLVLGLTKGKGLRLSKEVGQEDAMVLRMVDGVVGRGGSNEVRGDEFRSLVDKLVEGMLAIGPRSTPDDGLHKYQRHNRSE